MPTSTKTMTSFADVQEALRPLYDNSRTNYDLDNMSKLMEFLGNPQNRLRVVHIAGTSGKTSTAYYAAGLLQAAGHSVGLTVSPHVDEINERVQIDGVSLDERTFCKEFSIFFELLKKSGVPASYFECMVAFAYWEFARQQVDYAVVEVGLGGLLDGTNVVSREDKVCVITDIGLDHTEILGDTLSKIAAQKAGIIQPGNHVFMYGQTDEVNEAVANEVQKQTAILHLVPDASAKVPSEGLPAFQKRNLWLAAYAANYVLSRDDSQELTEKQIEKAIQTHIPARMEEFRIGGKTVIVDGAHNAQKLKTLLDSVHEKYPGQKIAALVGFVEGDAFRLHQALEAITENTEHLIATSFYSEKDYPKRSVSPDQIVVQCQELGFNDIQTTTMPAEALAELLGRPEKLLLVTGSFYLLNHIRPLIQKEES